LTDDGGLFGAELRITGGVITLNVFDVGAVVVFTTTFPTYVFAGGSYINIELAYDGIGNVAVYANYTNAASLPSIQFLANVVVGVGLSGGLFLALTGVKDSVHPTPVIVGPVARYGSAN
jgi:hypothetical protein